MATFFIFSPTSNHLHPLQVENCGSNSRLVVGEDANVKSGLKGLSADFKISFLFSKYNITTLIKATPWDEAILKI